MAARRALGADEEFNFEINYTPRRAQRAISQPLSAAPAFSIDVTEDTMVDAFRFEDDIRTSKKNAKLRKSIIAAAASVATAAVFVLPNALSTSQALQSSEVIAPQVAPEINDSVSRDAVREKLAETEQQTTPKRAAISSIDDVAQATNSFTLTDQTRETLADEAEAKAEEEAQAQAEAERQAQAEAQQAAAAKAVSAQAYAAPAPSGSAQGALDYAMAQIGKPYIWGSTGTAGYDCSGLVYAAYQSVGITLPRTSYAMANAGSAVAYEDIQPGDIIISYGGGHAGMYIGNGQMVNALNSNTGVIISSADLGGITSIRRIG